MGKSHNYRKKRRAGRNLFYLVRSTEKVSNPGLILCSRKPHKDKVWDKFADKYYDGLRWGSVYGMCYPKINRDEIKYDTEPIPVRLVLTDENPDLYIQRVSENLYIGELETFEKYYKHLIGMLFRVKKITQVKHVFRISPKLFPEITEKDGYRGVKIETI
jgi:hypothetical protein